MKKTLSLVLSALILILALLPAFPMDAKAADSSDYYWPVPGFYRLSGAYTGNGDNDHRGIDISSSGIADATVYAAKSGTVYKSYNGCPHVHASGYAVDCKCWCNFSMGNFVWIQHDDGTGARYMHLKKDSGIPAEGTRVEQGDPIGKVGSSGYSSGYHLHFEILENYRDNRSQINTNPTDSRHSGATGKSCMSYCYDLIAIDRYPSAVVVEITNKEGTKIYDRPCSEQTDEKAEVIGYLDKGENVMTMELVLNKVGNYWYRIEYNNTDAYVWAPHTRYVDTSSGIWHKSGGKETTDYLPYGKYWDVTWKVSSSLRMNKISAYIIRNSDGQVMYNPSVDIDTTSYQMGGDKIDYGLKYDKLPRGSYTLIIRAEAQNYYWQKGVNKTTMVYIPVYWAFEII